MRGVRPRILPPLNYRRPVCYKDVRRNFGEKAKKVGTIGWGADLARRAALIFFRL